MVRRKKHGSKRNEAFIPGYFHNGIYTKKVKDSNILRIPERCFTFDEETYEKNRHRFGIVRVIVKETRKIYELSADEFDRIRIRYDYGNGAGYLVPVRLWTIIANQLALI